MTDQSVSHFWNKYINKTRAYGVKSAAARWHVRHAEQYIKAHSEKRLVQHTEQDVEHYLREKGRNPGLEDWQYRQIVVSLQILFTDMIDTVWSAGFPWGDYISQSVALPVNHATLARDFQNIDPDNNSRTSLTVGDRGSSLYERVYAIYPLHIQNLIRRIRLKHYSIRTEQSYLGWFLRYLSFHSMRDPVELTERDISAFLEHLVFERKVASSTQAQALNALIFFDKHVLETDFSDNIAFARSKKPRRLPVVLSQREIAHLFENMSGNTPDLMAHLLYGCGMRLMECVRLRVLDIDFDYQQILVRETKGKKDRVVPIPQKLVNRLKQQVSLVRTQHQEDLTAGFGTVYLPEALARKYPNAEKELRWWYVFPSTKISTDPRSAVTRRHHLHETVLQRHIKRAAEKSGFTKRVNCHTLRHSFMYRMYCMPILQEQKIGRNPPAGKWLRHPHSAGIAGARGRIDHDDLYPCTE